MSSRRFILLALLLGLTLFVASCGDDNPADPADTTAPLIVSVEPSQDQNDVDVDHNLVITFNEDMAPASADGHVTLSNSTINDYIWTDARTLAVEHTDWPEGLHVTATVGTGLTDAAGNPLAQAFAWSFWTWTDEVLLLNSAPAAGAVNVPINTTIWLQFSQSMNGSTLPGAITVTSPDKTVHAYTLDSLDSTDEWVLTLTDNLPASALITVAVSTAAQSWDGTPLAEAASFQFTTGTGADLTPPQLVSIEPADGALIDTDTSYFRLTFSEPIDDSSLDPAMISGQLMSALITSDDPGVWSANHTVFTVGLRTPLIPGSLFRVEFNSFADINSNVNDDGFTWHATVAGTAQHFPVMDGWIQYFAGYYEETNPAKTSGEYSEFVVTEVKTLGEFWQWKGSDYSTGPSKDLPTLVNYDRLKLTSTAIQMLGFHEEQDMETMDGSFSPPIDWLRLPVQTGSWDGTVTFTEGTDESQVDYEVTVLAGTFDVPFGRITGKQEGGPPVLWLDCRKVALHYELSDSSVVFSAGTDTLWYAPGAGLVRQVSHEVQPDRTRHSDISLMWSGYEADLPPR